MVGDAQLLILLPLETRQVAPDNTVALTLKLGNQTKSRLTHLIEQFSFECGKVIGFAFAFGFHAT